MRYLALLWSIAIFLVAHSAGADAQNVPTKVMLGLCEDYLSGHETQPPGLLCAVWFEGWLASYSVGANGVQPDGKSVFGICEPATISPDMAIKIFVRLVHKYPAFFDQPHMNDTIFSVPWTLSQEWSCSPKK